MQILLIIIILAVFFNYNEIKVVRRKKPDREDYHRRPRYEHERSEGREKDYK